MVMLAIWIIHDFDVVAVGGVVVADVVADVVYVVGVVVDVGDNVGCLDVLIQGWNYCDRDFLDTVD